MPAKNSGLRFFVMYGSQEQARCRCEEDAAALARIASEREGERVTVWTKERVIREYVAGTCVGAWSYINQVWEDLS